ncbi:MAG TPA: hypothetical protein VK563_21255 [Puia sp.]|nr:hypothetical protein [Puia sp.]
MFIMPKELYFDISSAESGGSLYRVSGEGKDPYFYYNHSTYDDTKDELKVFETDYPDFAAFWTELTKDPKWFYLHPMFVHPEQRDFIRDLLRTVNWAVHPDKKWQESHQRQWKKVLTDPGEYYRYGNQDAR